MPLFKPTSALPDAAFEAGGQRGEDRKEFYRESVGKEQDRFAGLAPPHERLGRDIREAGG